MSRLIIPREVQSVRDVCSEGVECFLWQAAERDWLGVLAGEQFVGFRLARGFVRGMDMRSSAWAALLADEEQCGWMVPVLMLYHEHDEDPELRPGPIGPEKREEIIVQMLAGVVNAYRYFRIHRQQATSPFTNGPHRSAGKIGRNDLCPCGSGRKYKRCCGGVTIH
jgi:hypothetical protein